jgi:DNA-binding CsgD family transcriptional regulator
VLVGRDSERQAIARLLADARVGTSGVLAVVGEPGIGKTALLEEAAASATTMRVIRARGIESEAEIPFAGLLELLRPVLGVVPRLPRPQAEALGAALALRPASAPNRFAVGAATLGVLAAAAEAKPLLVLVDDVQWLDEASAAAVLFAVRRLVADPVAVLLALREGTPSPLEAAGLPTLRLGGLDAGAAAELLAHRAAGPVAPDAVERLHRATAGNPLALLELPADEAALGARPVVSVSARIRDAFLQRAAPLPPEGRRALLLAAASETSELAVLARAAGSLGLGVEALAHAERAGLVEIAGATLEFRHPLARAAVYADAPPADRRSAHRALAAALPDRDADERAWHLAQAAIGPDDAACAALEASGSASRARGAYAGAAGAFERAARLSESDERASRLLLDAAEAYWLAGLGSRALTCLDRVAANEPAAALRARADRLRGSIAMRRGPLRDAVAILVSGAEAAAVDDPDAAVAMLADAAYACFYAGDTAGMVAAAARAVELGEGRTGVTAFFAAISAGFAEIFEGGSGAVPTRRAMEVLETTDELRNHPRFLFWASLGPLWLREGDVGRPLIERAAAAARQSSALGILPAALHHLARYDAGADRWHAAYVGYHEAVRLSREAAQPIDVAAALAGLAWLEARQGRAREAREHAEEALRIANELGVAVFRLWALAALGDLAASLGHAEEAAARYEELARELEARGIGDVDLSPAPELVEAYLRLGRPEDAALEVDRYTRAAEAKGQPWSRARAARARALVAGDSEFEGHFEQALALHERTLDVFERARTQLAYGARLRRVRRRVAARAKLRAALETFDALGAEPWAETAASELAATGLTARRRDSSTLADLTPQELQVALLLTEGHTTREAAAALFLSPKTVEYHLRHVYQKLGISSREALADALSETGRSEERPATTT